MGGWIFLVDRECDEMFIVRTFCHLRHASGPHPAVWWSNVWTLVAF